MYRKYVSIEFYISQITVNTHKGPQKFNLDPTARIIIDGPSGRKLVNILTKAIEEQKKYEQEQKEREG